MTEKQKDCLRLTLAGPRLDFTFLNVRVFMHNLVFQEKNEKRDGNSMNLKNSKIWLINSAYVLTNSCLAGRHRGRLSFHRSYVFLHPRNLDQSSLSSGLVSVNCRPTYLTLQLRKFHLELRTTAE